MKITAVILILKTLSGYKNIFSIIYYRSTEYLVILLGIPWAVTAQILFIRSTNFLWLQVFQFPPLTSPQNFWCHLLEE
jgi:hypothetical protein